MKRFENVKLAWRERDIMQSYPEDAHFVRYYGSYVLRKKGRIYANIVMEWVKGESILQAIKRRGRLRPRKVIALAMDILKGLDVLHRAGIVHGDIHHNNVLIIDFHAARTKLIDFQMAARKNCFGKARSHRARPNPPLKLPPETRQRSIDDSYDLYGVGCLCAVMLIGKVPFRRATITRRRRKNRALWRVIRKAMRKDPKRRYHSAAEMMEALCAVQAKMDHSAS